jgi:hypothetical protein
VDVQATGGSPTSSSGPEAQTARTLSVHSRTAVKVEKSCPVPNTHSRLRQAHDAWHEALDAYPDPAEFTRRINALIPALRAVTLMMQKELKGADWFESWYAPWRTRMEADPRMRWVVDARNHIEHRGDLDTHSTARVTVLAGAARVPHCDLEVSPLLSPSEVAQQVVLCGLPEDVLRDATLKVERRWVAEGLANHEILDALAHCYGMLATIVVEAHDRSGVQMQTFGGETHGGRHQRSPHPSGRLPCMLVGQEARTAYWHLGEDLEVSVEATQADVDPADIPAIAERYGDLILPSLPEGDAVDQALTFHTWAKQMLAQDGYHVPHAFLLGPGGHATIVRMLPDDQQGKDVMMERLAQEVLHHGSSSVVFTTETWLAPMVPANDPRARVRARDRADRSEALVTYAITREGRARTLLTRFARPRGRIRLESTVDQDGVDMAFLSPLKAVWSQWPDTGDVRARAEGAGSEGRAPRS